MTHSLQVVRRARTAGFGLVGWVALVCAAASAHAAVVADGRAVRDFNRITFEWPEATRLQSSMSGNVLTVTFDRRVSAPDFSRLLTRLPKVVKSASVKGDGRTVVMKLDKAYRVRNFVSGRMNGVDLLRSEQDTAKTDKKAEEKAKALEKAKAAEKEKAAAIKKLQQKEAKQKAEQAKREKLLAQKAAKEQKQREQAAAKAAAQVAQVQPAATNPPAAATPAPAAEVAPSPKPEETAPITVPDAASTAAPVASPVPDVVIPAPQRIVQGNKHPNAVPLNVTLTASGNDVLVQFPWGQRTAAAAFRRGDTDWVVFDQPAVITVANPKPFAAIIPEISSSNVGQHTVVQMRAPSLNGLRMVPANNGNGWQLTLSSMMQEAAQPLAVQAKTGGTQKSSILVAALEPAPSVTVQDPVVGDTLVLVPTYTGGQGVEPGRRMVELDVPSTAQGVVVIPHVADISITPQRNGLKITTSDGLQLSEGIPTPRTDMGMDSGGNSLFAKDEMAPPASSTLSDFIAELLPLTAQKGAVANEARRRMAMAYLSEGLATEALGEIETIRSDDLDYYIREKLSAYSALANFLLYRLPESARDFAAPELMNSEEAEYWRVVLAELNGQSDVLFDYQPFRARYARQYPPLVQQRLGVIAADRLVARSRFNEALAVLEGMGKSKLDKDSVTAHAMAYLTGEVLARTGYEEKAEAKWRPLIADLDDRYWRARALYALVNLRLSTGKMTAQEAIDQLEVVRVLWRADPIELQTLTRLAILYMDQKNYRAALRSWREITQAYPNTEDAFKASEKMAETFVYLFNENGAKGMKPLEALALYYEFKDLTPVEEAGDQMIRNLADRLAEVDLLDRAAALLEHQVRFRLQGESRSRVGAQLALLYLFNRQPQRALDVMELTGYGANPEDLQQKRTLLTARALADLKEGERAIALLEDDSSIDAQLLKLDVQWDQGNWDKVVGLGEGLLSNRSDPSAMLTEPEVGALLKLSVAYTFQKDAAQLKYLRDYFSPLVAAGAQKDLFTFLTNDTPIAPENVAQLAQNITQMQGFLSRWRSQVREGGLSKTVQ